MLRLDVAGAAGLGETGGSHTLLSPRALACNACTYRYEADDSFLVPQVQERTVGVSGMAFGTPNDLHRNRSIDR